MIPASHDLGVDRQLGRVATAVVGITLLAWALTVDFPKATGGFFSDGATYYSLAHSLAEDFDFEFRREDLVRVWREFPSGPEGIFLKRGRDVTGVASASSLPFLQLATADDPDPGRLYYGKSFIFPLFASPFVWLWGTNGFLVLHAVLMTLCFACAVRFLSARGRPLAAVVYASAFLFASTAPVYMAWLTPDFFNLSMVLFGYYFWCYKEVADSPGARHGQPTGLWTRGLGSDLLAVVCLGIATFSKPTHVLLVGPVLALFALRRQWVRALIVGTTFACVTGGLFAWNIAISGEWNYQGGQARSTFYSADPDAAGPRLGGFPFQTDQHTFDATGIPRETNRVPVEVLTTSDAVGRVFRRNLVYFFLGRHTGFVPYYFPGALAVLLFLGGALRRPAWQWLTLAGGLGSAAFLLLYMPYTYSGGGGPVGNRYFLGVYPVFLFILPPLFSAFSGLVAIAIGALFTAQLVLNPYYSSVRPMEHTKSGLFRYLPIERSLLNDLPVNVSPSRVKQPLGGTPPISAYFLDDNAYAREADAFWVRGESRAELLLRAPVMTEAGPDGEVVRPLRVVRMTVELETGAMANRVSLETDAGREVVDIPAHDRRILTVAMPAGLPYKPFPELPTNYVYEIAIESSTGFIPMFTTGGRDARFLGIFVRLVPQYE
ncbi:MAG: hypothetical protein ACT4QD_18815 [Acidobacteriota bacterium]